jgi:hypothetical protein
MMFGNGHHDLFISMIVFLPVAILVSAASLCSNVNLLRRQAVSRRGQLLGRASSRLSGRRISVRRLAQEYVLHRDEEKHREETNGNNISLRQFYLAMLLLLVEVRSVLIGHAVANYPLLAMFALLADRTPPSSCSS